MLFDSHCHLDMEPLSGEQGPVIERAAGAGVTAMVNVGASLRGSQKSVELSNSYPNIWATVGLHPHDAGVILDLDSVVEELRNLAANDKVIAIGEIGLDFFDAETRDSVSEEVKQEQTKLFVAQLDLAAELGLPVVLHVRDAWDETYNLVKGRKLKAENPGVVHCYTGDEKEVKRWLDLGFYIGFTGFVTFDQSKFDHIREAAKVVPLEKLLVETDSPFLAPEPYRGKTNEPAFVAEVAKKIAELKDISFEHVASTTYKNSQKVFNIK